MVHTDGWLGYEPGAPPLSACRGLGSGCLISRCLFTVMELAKRLQIRFIIHRSAVLERQDVVYLGNRHQPPFFFDIRQSVARGHLGIAAVQHDEVRSLPLSGSVDPQSHFALVIVHEGAIRCTGLA